MKRLFLIVLALLAFSGISYTQSLDSLLKKLPKLNASFKYDAEHDVEENETRFIVKSARISAKGAFNPYFDYVIQLDFSAEGDFRVLDLAAGFNPYNGVKINVGQIKIPFSSNYIITPADLMFSNGTFAGGYINGPSRDIGITGSYSFNKVPIELEAGVFNGSGINNPQYESSPGYAVRAVFGTMQRCRASVKYFQQNASGRDKVQRYGADARYGGKNFRLETEASFRRTANDFIDWTYYVQSAYRFDLKKTALLKYIEPTLRWDDMIMETRAAGLIDDSKARRATAGINFGFDIKPLACEFRINYESYFTKNIENAPANIYDVDSPNDFNNKVIFGLVIKL